VAIPPEVLANYQSVNAQAQQTAATPFQTYGGEFVAPVNSQQQTGIAGTNAAATEAQPYYQAATGQIANAQSGVNPINQAATGLAAASAQQVNAQPITGQQIDQYMSPYLQDVVGSESALLNQNNQQQQAGQMGTAIQSGAFGGDRSGIAAANLSQQQNLANANIYSGLLNQGYNTALSTAQQQQGVNLSAGQANRAALGSAATNLSGIGQTAYGEGANTATTLANLGTGAQTAGLQGANAQLAAGTVEQQTQQAQDTAQYNQFLQQQSYPFQVDQFLANIAEGTGALSGSTTTTQQPGGFFSDERLKTDKKPIGKTFDGQTIYSYKMHGDPRTQIGLMAQDVERKHPEAVGLAAGYKTVDYGKATRESANDGQFASGGVAGRRIAYASGGGPYGGVDPSDMSDILAAQQRMYQQQHQNRDIPNQGSSHQLAVANGSPSAGPSGSSKVSQSIGLGQKGYQAYKHFNPSTPSTTGLGSAGSDPQYLNAAQGSLDSAGTGTSADVGAANATGLDGTHILSVHELVVHVEQVLVHEGVVAGHLAVQPARLVFLALGKPERLRNTAFRQRRIAWKDKNQAVNLPRGIPLHPVRKPLLAEVRHIHTLAGLVVSPPVVMALQLIALDHAQVQRHLPMRTAVLEREHPPGLAAVQDYGLAGEPAGKRFALLQLI